MTSNPPESGVRSDVAQDTMSAMVQLASLTSPPDVDQPTAECPVCCLAFQEIAGYACFPGPALAGWSRRHRAACLRCHGCSAMVKLALESDESASLRQFFSLRGKPAAECTKVCPSRDGWLQAGGTERRCQGDDVSCEAREED